MFGNYQMWSSFSPLWSSELYVANEDQEWSWLTQAQMAQWHQEDEKWLKARSRARVAADMRYWSAEESLDRLVAYGRAIAYTELMREVHACTEHQLEVDVLRGRDGPAMD